MGLEKRVYLDWAAASPLLPEAKAAMQSFWTENFGNPGSIHKEGMVAKNAVFKSRKKIANSLQVRPEMITFTGSGTESNNLSIVGIIDFYKEKRGISYNEMEVVSTKIEHPSVINVLAYLRTKGIKIKWAQVNKKGKIDLDYLKNIITDKTILFTTSLVNSEVGVIQEISSVRKVISKINIDTIIHVDAAQAPLWLNCQLEAIKADIMTFDAGKFCGPKAVGFLVRNKRVNLLPVFYGGKQESGLRPGTENVVGIIGAAEAFVWAQSIDKIADRARRISEVRDLTIKYINTKISEAVLNGPDGDGRVANNINISLPGIDTEFITVVLDKAGFAVSTKSACSGSDTGKSYVVEEITNNLEVANSTLRITLGIDTTYSETKSMVDVLRHHLDKTQNFI